jgi:hypothetical protein
LPAVTGLVVFFLAGYEIHGIPHSIWKDNEIYSCVKDPGAILRWNIAWNWARELKVIKR